MSSTKLQYSESSKVAVGQRVALARRRRGLKQGQLAEILGLAGPAGISNYEKGRNLPPGEKMEQLSVALGVTLDWLLTGAERKGFIIADPIEEYAKGLSRDDQEILRAVGKRLKKMTPSKKEHLLKQVYWLSGGKGEPPKRGRK